MSVQYVGSQLHKRYPWQGAPPSLRNDKTECPPDVPAEEAQRVLERDIAAAITSGTHSLERSGDHPKFVWGRSQFRTTRGTNTSIAWEAVSSSRTAMQYHAYPIQPDRHSDTMPPAVEAILWPDT